MSNINKLPIVKSSHRGKVRDIYDLGDKLLIVTSDRISAFDSVFPTLIKNKGKILNQISLNFFEMTKDIIPNHLITANVDEYPEEFLPFKEELQDRSMLVKKTRVVPFECIVRGYITGSAWKEYKKFGTMNGIMLAEGLKESQRFESPVFTPSTKAEEGHDENISYKEMCRRMDTKLAEEIKSASLEIYKKAHDFLLNKGIILADTKFEFGTLNGQLILIDEILTPDSSRFWDKEEYQTGSSPKSYDKQYVRDYISDAGWDKQPPAPELPAEVAEKTFSKYYEAYRKIAGERALTWK
ncbi:MAG: phosphoribosylaminoimidazolesuccinocarboxamide synthase [Candidatus Cloacimonadota bacterium]|nr:MAG: phosphoribosylaminoimidazolesuccinocarboxamide synthase [Candidatus Cloacimonadota bacterium]